MCMLINNIIETLIALSLWHIIVGIHELLSDNPSLLQSEVSTSNSEDAVGLSNCRKDTDKT